MFMNQTFLIAIINNNSNKCSAANHLRRRLSLTGR